VIVVAGDNFHIYSNSNDTDIFTVYSVALMMRSLNDLTHIASSNELC